MEWGMARSTKEIRMSSVTSAPPETITLEVALAPKKSTAQVRRAAMAELHDLANEPEA